MTVSPGLITYQAMAATTSIHPKLNYRYSRQANTMYIDIHIDFYREIYNVWDFSPLVNRDLDDDLFEYLENCAGEIPKKYQLAIVFYLPAGKQDPEKESKSIRGFRNYFQYQLHKLRLARKNIFRQISLYGFFGLILIFLATGLRQAAPALPFIDVIIEGLFIGGWVLFWELFSGIFFKQADIRHRKNILTRLMQAEIAYQYMD